MRHEPFAPFRNLVTGLEEKAAFPDEPLVSVGDFAKLLGTLAQLCRAFAHSGRRIDLGGLDQKVGLLCAKALDLPPEQGREARAELILLRNEIEQLGQILEQPLVGR
jgi:hypothetical protein